MPEKTLVLIKPDALRRGLVGDILRRFEAKGLRIAGLKMLRFDAELARRLYVGHVHKPYYPAYEAFMTSGPCLAVAVEGEDAIETVRRLMGDTNHLKAAPGTIRGDCSFSTRENLVHGSDSPGSAECELPLFFGPEEMF